MSTSRGQGITNGVSYTYKLTERDGRCTEILWNLKRPMEAGKVNLFSSDFEVANSIWRLRISPHGRIEEDRDFIGAFLICESRDHYQVFFSFTAISISGDRMCMGGNAFFTDEHHSWGFSRFLHHKIVHDYRTQYYQDNTLRLIVTIRVQDPWAEVVKAVENHCSVHESPAWSESKSTNAECVVCLSAPQTSGFLHGTESHRCVCENCAKKLQKRRDLLCPVCMEPVEKVIYKYF